MDKRFVIDHSVVMAWCFEDEISPYADFILDSLENTAAQADLYTGMKTYPLDINHILLPAYVTPDIVLNRQAEHHIAAPRFCWFHL